MSHFKLAVIGPNIKEQLQPFHKYESTGLLDQYVRDIDRTEEVLVRYATETTRRLRDPQGALHEPWKERFYRDPTADEQKILGPGPHGFGGGHGLSWDSRDWGDGKGYRTKIRFIPDGWESLEVPVREVKPAAQWASGYYGWPIASEFGYEPTRDHPDYKDGFISLNIDGSIKRCVDRTNPNRKWGWWEIGGRYTGYLLLKDGSTCDSATKDQIDWSRMPGQGDAGVIFQVFAMLREGQWAERGEMGWWGIVSDGKDVGEWRKWCAQQIEALPDDALITIVDCHI